MYYAKYFFITSIIGFIIESVVCGNFKGNSGILYGPWTVVYGFGSVLILLINKIVSKNIKNKVLKIISLFIISTISLTILELIGGILIEKIFGIVFWDYSDCKYNIGKYICLEMSLLWGIASIAFIYLLKPLIDKIIKYIPNIVIYILIFFILLDLITTLFLKLVFNKK